MKHAAAGTKTAAQARLPVPDDLDTAPTSTPVVVALTGLAGGPAAGTVQRSLRVGSADDPAELEAEATAESIVAILRRRARPAQHSSDAEPVPVPADTTAALVRRSATVGAAGGALDDTTAATVQGLRGRGQPLPAPVRRRMEQAFEADFSDVRVHTGARATELNDRVQAQAFTVGSDIVFSAGLPNIEEESGQRLLAHELTHVVQQGGPDRLAALRRQSARTAPRSAEAAGTIRRVWLATGKSLTWDRVLAGLRWHFDRDADAFFYEIADAEAVRDPTGMIAENAGKRLSESELDKLGFEEIAFEVGDDRVEFVAPPPKWGPVDPRAVVPRGSGALVAELEVLLKKQTANRNYDRLIYINSFILFKAQNPQYTDDEALARFELRSAEIVEQCQGGHCGGLSGSLLKEVDYGPGAYLVGSKLPASFQQEKAPEYCHVAAMIRFQNPETAADNGLILLEPGFNITKPIVVRKGETTSLPMGPAEVWDFTVDDACTEVVCQPRPAPDAKAWAAKKSREARMTYRTDVFLNPDESLTKPLLRIDGRPQILARDEHGEVAAVIAINYAKRQIEFRIGKDKAAPVGFAAVDAGGAWLKGAEVPLSKLMHIPPKELITRIYHAVQLHQPK
ncbi:MAG: DUF4157 domain-containing protein [Jatrophihabitantaceae bacterium]